MCKIIFPSGFLALMFEHQFLYVFLVFSMYASCLACLILDVIALIIIGKFYSYRSYLIHDFAHSPVTSSLSFERFSGTIQEVGDKKLFVVLECFVCAMEYFNLQSS
jgi:hypothetical protein